MNLQSEIVFVALFSVASAVAMVARRINLPYTVALVVTGLVLGSVHALEPPHLTKELLYSLFLPGLIFEAAFALEFEHFWQNRLAILSLALPGLVVAIVLTAAILTPIVGTLHLASDFTFAHGFVFSSVIAATDPIAVVALFRALGVPKRLGVLVEGESLLNDGTSIVVFTLVLAAVTGGTISARSAVIDFVSTVGMGVLTGSLVGYTVSKLIQRVDDPMIEITLTTIAAYGSFVAAESFHYSGVIATVTSGMLCGNYGARTGMSASTRVAVATFWEYLAFALNSVVFLLIGFEVKVENLLSVWKPITVAYLATMLGRAVVLHLVAGGLALTRERVPMRWAGVLTWGGLRGGLSMVLVLGLPREMAHRDLLVAMTFGVVIVSILVQGTSMGPLLRRLGLVGSSEARAKADRLRGRRKAVGAALAEVTRMASEGDISPVTAERLREQYEKERESVEASFREVEAEANVDGEDEWTVGLRRALIAERDALNRAYRAGQIGSDSHETLVADVDAQLFKLTGEGQ